MLQRIPSIFIDMAKLNLMKQLRPVSIYHVWIGTRATPNFISRLQPLSTSTAGNSSVPSVSSPQIPGMFDDGAAKSNHHAKMKSSLNDHELAKFSAIADSWWHSEGPFKPLHLFNPTRLAFIRSTLCRHFKKDPTSTKPFEGLKIVDVGCGGGILSEPLARLGASVTGIDAVDQNIKVARLHADLDPTTSTIEYCYTTAEKLVEEGRKFDAVISSEVIEHVANPSEFCQSLSALSVPGGATIVSTINRSMRGYVATIVVAEYILQWLPKGTHQWSSFITPEEVALMLQRASIDVNEMAGIEYNPVNGRWLLSDDISVNYIAYGAKRDDEENKEVQ